MGITLRPNCIFRLELNIVDINVDINVPPISSRETGVRSAIGRKNSYYETIMNLDDIITRNYITENEQQLKQENNAN